MDACEYTEVEMADKYLWGKSIIGLTESTKKSLLHKLFPAATEFGQLVKKAALWQLVCINELFIADRMWSFKVAGILNIFTL